MMRPVKQSGGWQVILQLLAIDLDGTLLDDAGRYDEWRFDTDCHLAGLSNGLSNRIV
ncbi:hypothetical protein NE303_00995 [Levilactobacillus brevis]|uniref:hypothetical protein n=2 Tax=Levilactobacillus brevis TaxID=1580 RepID=UPI00159B8B23|nr:hypothetical protein [Levilactobacillus brevis]MCE6017362.1 hypothetical protein [Levilactobacillus brevis]MCE6019675.1 hypothetical protein [Levilactobacillus brevis]MCE6033094.1 hypothetical protein [Levilactobacillus brevis]MCM6799943.1 hypothetical protein [Levilactobacillus brevis]MCM6801358.1 hypothetical protein [Levilactobacillus brevis]